MSEMQEIALSNEQITVECKEIVNVIGKKSQRLKELVLVMKSRLDHGEFIPWLNSIGIPRSTAWDWMQQVKTAKLPKPQMSGSGHLPEQEELIQPGSKPTERISPEQFNRETSKIKKENEALFSNQGKFVMHRFKEFITDDIPGKLLPDLAKLSPQDLAPADLDLALQIIEELGGLIKRATIWHKELKEKFNVK